MEGPPLHPDVSPLAFLLGEWQGHGHGEYPTIESFDYLETVRFTHVGKPFLAYTQATRDRLTGVPLHAEAGYWRCLASGDDDRVGVEVVIAQPSGITEVLEGTMAGARWIELTSTTVSRTTTAKEVTAVERRFEVDGDELRYTLAMAAVGHRLTHHLSAELRRV